MIARAQRQLPPGMPSPPSFQKVNPADSPVLFLTLSSPTLPLSQLDRYAQNLLAQRLSMVTRRGPGERLRVAEVRGSRGRRSPRSSRRGRSGSTRWRRRSPPPTSTARPARSTGPTGTSCVQTSRAAAGSRGLRVDRRRLPERQPGAAERGGARVRRRRERAQRQLVQRHAHDLPRRPAPARHQHGRGGRPHQGAAAEPRAAAAGRRSSSRIRSDRSVPIRESVDDVKFTLVLTVVPRRARDLPVPAERVGDDHPEPGAAVLDRRHVRGDVRCSATASTTCR